MQRKILRPLLGPGEQYYDSLVVLAISPSFANPNFLIRIQARK